MMIPGIDAGLVDVPQHLGTFPTGPRVAVGQRVICTRTISPASADDDCPVGIWISVSTRRSKWHDIAEAGAVGLETADDGFVAAVQNLDDATLEPLWRLALDACDDAVAVHRFEQIRAGDIDVFPFAGIHMLGYDKAEPAGIRRETADDKVHLVAQAKTVAANLHEFAGGDERFQLSLERRAFLARYPEDLGQLSSCCGMVNAVADELKE
jgi:hypothetical protein